MTQKKINMIKLFHLQTWDEMKICLPVNFGFFLNSRLFSPFPSLNLYIWGICVGSTVWTEIYLDEMTVSLPSFPPFFFKQIIPPL